MSFDISAQIEEVFENAGNSSPENNANDDVFVKPKVTPKSCERGKKKKRVSFDIERGSPLKLAKISPDAKQRSDDFQTANEVLRSEKDDALDDDSDFFGDSFLNVDALDELEALEKKANNRTVNKSCPKTPKFDACTEELDFSDIKDETIPQKENKEEDIVDDANSSITDSFLEAAFDKHMTAELESSVVDNKKVEVLDKVVHSPASKSIQTRSMTTVESPMRSQRLMQRKMEVKRAASRRAANKLSPGSVLIFSDSDSEFSESSPAPKPKPEPDVIAKEAPETKPENKIKSDEGYLMNVVDVCSSRELFSVFSKEIKAQTAFAMALACDQANIVKKENKDPNPQGIGQRTTRPKKNNKKKDEDNIPDEGVIPELDLKIVGAAFSWNNLDAYYLSLQPGKDPKGKQLLSI